MMTHLQSDQTTMQQSDLICLFEFQRLKLLTYNIFIRPVWIKNNESDHKDDRLTIFIQQFLNDFDIICLQEIFGFFNTRIEKIMDQALLNNQIYFAMSPTPSFSLQQIVSGGCLTISRFPIIYQQHFQYPLNILADYISYKGILYTKIKVSNTCIHLFNTHLQASYYGDLEQSQQSIYTKIIQLKYLHNVIKQTVTHQKHNQNDLIMIAGDLNINALDTDILLKLDQNYLQYFGYDQTINLHSKYNEYQGMLHLLQGNDYLLRDIKYLSSFVHPTTFAEQELINGKSRPKETVLTLKVEQEIPQSLDYLIELVPKDKNHISDIEFIKVDEKTMQIQKFEVEGQVFRQLSDHYGVSVDMVLFSSHSQYIDSEIVQL